jgi:immunoglobulin-binding protein 1
MQELYNESRRAIEENRVQNSIDCLKQLSLALETSGEVYSSNEELSDVSTFSLKYFLARFELAEQLQRVRLDHRSPDFAKKRVALIGQCVDNLTRFVRLMLSFELLDYAVHKEALLRYAGVASLGNRQCDEDPFAAFVGNEGNASGERRRSDAVARESREAMIARAKYLMQVERALADLDERRRKRGARSAASGDDDKVVRRQDDDAERDDDEDIERRVMILKLRVQAVRAIDELKSLAGERGMLEQVAAAGGPRSVQQRRQRQRGGNASSSSAPESKNYHIPAPGAAAVPIDSLRERPSVQRSQEVTAAAIMGAVHNTADEALAAPLPAGGGVAPGHVQLNGVATTAAERMHQRAVVKDAVFKPGWRLPTMTVEQAGELDMRFAAKGAGGAASEKDANDDEPGYDSEEARADDDEAARKQREWDDWCDYNPVGAGNRINQG